MTVELPAPAMAANWRMPARAGTGLALDAGAELADFQHVQVQSQAGPYEASAEERKLLCLLKDGRLLVADGQALNPHVLSYQARLQRMGCPFDVLYVRIDTIRRINHNTPGGQLDRHQEHSMMQVTAKDLLSRACNARASDIHIRVRKTTTEIHFRVHNDLVPVSGQTREYGERLVATLYGAMTSVSDSSYKPSERQDASIADRDKLPPVKFLANGTRILYVLQRITKKMNAVR